MLSLVGSAVSLLLLGSATSLPALLAWCFAYGLLVDAMNPASHAMVADLVPPEHRLAAYAADRLAINLGFTLGPIVAGLLLEKSFWALFVADAVSSVAYAAIALLWLPRTVGRAGGFSAGELRGQWAVFRDVSRHRPLLTYLLGILVLAIVFRQFTGALPLQMAAAGCRPFHMGLVYMINGLLIVLVEIPLTHVTRRWPLRAAMALGTIIIGEGFALNGLGISVPLVVASMIVLTIGEMLAFSRTGTYLASLSPVDRRGRYAGLNSFSWGIGGIVGATLGLTLYEFSPEGTWICCGLLTLVAAAIFAIPDDGYLWRSGRSRPASRNPAIPMSPKEIVDHVFQTFRDCGHLDYGENVTEAQHALQCATLARADGEPAEIVTACLLHDFGHLVHDLGQDIAKKGIDARHESIGANRLCSLFVEEVVEPVRLHVAAKRYLCWKNREYCEALSDASRESLHLQGGPMSDDEAAAFEANPHSRAAVRVRHYDDLGKIEEMVTPDSEAFRTDLESFARK